MPEIRYDGATPLEDRAIRQIVGVAMDAPARARSGHSGTAMALAPFGVMLWSRVLRHDPTDPTWFDRDRFVLSCGHASILQYALAHSFGYDVTREDLMSFRQLHSRTPGHPERGVTPTVEATTGPLGQGVANGVGLAMAERVLRAEYGEDLVDHRTWVVAGDGCLEEGVSHEAASLAGYLGLDRLTVFYDDNHITIDGPTELALRDDPAGRFRAYGWHVIELGERANDLVALEAAVRAAVAETTRPSLVVIRSHIGFPSPEMMDTKEAHGNPFSPEAISKVKEMLGLVDEPFVLDDDLPAAMLESLAPRREANAAWRARVTAAGERGTRLLHQVATHAALDHDVAPEPYEAGTKAATRRALQRAIDAFSPHMPGLVAGSADLTENTGVALTGTVAQDVRHPGGRQIHFGIREFAMSASVVGMAHHGGIRPVGSTFFVFSDYARPAVRLAALSEAPALFVYTHDSIGVGEDGPTHQPVEHLMSLRAMPHLHVVRPSDANEALDLVGRVLRARDPAPTALVLSRQDLVVFGGAEATASREGAHRGGYVVREVEGARFTLVATGSEVSLCLAAADELAARGVAVRVAALPCWKCFEDQPTAYRDAVVRRDLPSLAVEAGATLGWARYADEALGIDTFGLSAPGPQVFTALGLVPETVVAHVTRVLNEEP